MHKDLWDHIKVLYFVCFFLSKFELPKLNVAASLCGWGYFQKCSLRGCRYFYTHSKTCDFKIS